MPCITPTRLAIGAALIAALPGCAGSERRPIAPEAQSRQNTIEPTGPTAELVFGAAGAPLTFAAGAGVQGIAARRWFWATRGVVQSPLGSTDYNDDGRSDWILSDGGPHVDVRAELGLSLRRTVASFRVLHRRSLRRVTSRGEAYLSWYPGVRSTHWFLVAGARASVLGDRVWAIPVGVRLHYRETVPKRFSGSHRERWYQARVLVFPDSRSVGVDAEALLPWYGLFLYSEFVPALGDPATSASCSAGGTCEPPYPASSFNMTPGHRQLMFGAGIRLYAAWRSLSK